MNIVAEQRTHDCGGTAWSGRCEAHNAPAPMLITINGREQPACLLCVEQNHAALVACVREERTRDAERQPAFWALLGAR